MKKVIICQINIFNTYEKLDDNDKVEYTSEIYWILKHYGRKHDLYFLITCL